MADLQIADPLIPAIQLGLSILYVAQFDPALTESSSRSLRHFVRILGSSIICLTALLVHRDTVLTSLLVSILTILLGLGLQIRALLYVGTATFLLTGTYHLGIWMVQDAWAKWVVGLVVGIALISVAANFERHRLKMSQTTQSLKDQLSHWE